MGSAMLSGWRTRGLSRAVVVDPTTPLQFSGSEDVEIVPSASDIPATFQPGVVVLAVKPQVAPSSLPDLSRFADASLFISIMAGQTIHGMTKAIAGGGAARIVRAMPNTPAAIGHGVTVACVGPGVSAEDRAVADRLLRSVGEVAWTEAEADMDAVTAVSGSGPAYVFLLAESMEQAAIEQGLAPALARLLARQTVAGAGALLAATDEDAADLRRSVTSPAGTTAAALSVLMADDAMPSLIARAVRAAADRSRALAAATAPPG
jgi:pyrroline-5-carboxylate reductase